MANRKLMIRKLRSAALLILVMCCAPNVAALGLGALQIQSNLDQPLEGSIELRVAPGDDLSSVTAQIASAEDFEKLGIDYPNYLQDISISVENMGGDSYVLRVVSNDVIIKEPFIHFLVRVDWSGGSFLREYTALIDPPVYAAEAPPSVAQPVVVGDDQAYQAESADIYAEEISDADSTDAGNNDGDVYDDSSTVESQDPFQDPQISQEDTFDTQDQSTATLPTDARYGPVASGESLSVIAAELQRQFPDLSIYQIMQVLFEENQDSFIDGNINGLLQGAVLNLGDLNTIRQVDIVQAKQFFYDQLTEWDPSVLVDSGSANDSLRVGQDEYLFDDSIASSDSIAGSDSSLGSGTESFQVGSSSEADAFVSNADTASNAGEVLALQQQISELETSLTSSNLENQELTERISLLEGQLADMNRLLSMDVENADLAAVEATLAEQNNSADVNLDNELIDPIVGEEVSSFEADSDNGGFVDPLAGLQDSSTDSVDGLSLDDGTDSDTVIGIDESGDGVEEIVADESSAIEVSSTETVNAKPTPIKASPSFMDNVKTTLIDEGLWKAIAGVGALVLGGLGLWFVRRRRADEEFEISMMSIESQSHSASTEKEVSVPEEPKSAKSPDRETSFLTVYSDSDAVVQADEVDPVAEADVYIAYGRDEQAEEVLLDGIAAKPSRVDIKQKLLSLYHKNNNVEGFERISEELYSQRNFLTREVWQEVSLMGKDIAPDNPLFDVSASELLADTPEDGGNMITSGDMDKSLNEMESQTELESDLTVSHSEESTGTESTADLNSDSAEAEQESVASADFLEEDSGTSINLINFDDEQSQLSELDEVNLDDLSPQEGDSDMSSQVSESQSTSSISSIDEESEKIEDYEVEDSAVELEGDSVFEIDLEQPNDEATSKDDPQTVDASESIISDSAAEVSDLEIEDDYDESRTQYELAKVFVDLGDEDGARKILDDIVANNEISADVLEDANKLLESINT